ncbi:MAG TPA: hypothetical protein VHX65_16930 [Pirellulales bacterium]|jgi:hypothetical protein|nr:hypothetical protein [Pirellulales bacterium]
MGLFTGDPNPGYLATLVFTPDDDDAVTLGANMIDDDTAMAWNRANIFNSDGNTDHSKGPTAGRVVASGVWDTGASAAAQTALQVGAIGTLSISYNSDDTGQASPAKVARWHTHADAAGQVTWDVEFIKDNQIQNQDGEDANDATIS